MLTIGYRCALIFFGLIIVGCLVAFPHAVSCCSHFSAADLELKKQIGITRLDPGITPLAVALLDWPMGFRLLLMTLVAAMICFISCALGFFVTRAKASDRKGEIVNRLVQGLLASVMTGVLYILAAYAAGFVGYLGPKSLIWMLGIPAVITIISWPRPIGLLMAFPVALGGWIALGAISISVGIPID